MNETEVLFSDILNCPRQELYLRRRESFSREQSTLVAAVLKRRIAGEPLAYIRGKAFFFGLEFKVGPEVLIPRPETEILVERTIELALCVLRFAPCVKILELGTGSGCIAISLAKFLTDVEITATDISVKALEIAKSNAVLNNVSGKINFFQNDLLTHNPQLTTQNDIIVCNPPYIPTSEISRLQPEVQQEPRLALDGGRDGLDFYRRIIKTVPRYLQRGGYLIMEMGYKQCQAIEKIIVDSERLSILEVIKDYSGIERMMVVQKNY